MKRFYFLLCSLFFLQAAAPQKYYITETQLESLEKTLASYKTNKATQERQLRALETKAESLEKTCEALQIQLASERETTRNLSSSLTKYESKFSQNEAEKLQALQDIERLKVIISKWKIRFVICGALLIVLIMTIAGYIFLKLKIR